MLSEMLAGLILASGAQDAAAPSASNPAPLIAGEWEVVDGESRQPAEGCAMAQIFKASPDGRHIDLTERGEPNWSARYLVVHRENDRILLFIEDEDRLTKQGDPVLWWANFDGPDHFKWRRYDWSAAAATSTT